MSIFSTLCQSSVFLCLDVWWWWCFSWNSCSSISTQHGLRQKSNIQCHSTSSWCWRKTQIRCDRQTKCQRQQSKFHLSFRLSRFSFHPVDCLFEFRRFIAQRSSWRWSISSETIRWWSQRSKFSYHHHHQSFNKNIYDLENRKDTSSLGGIGFLKGLGSSTCSTCRKTGTCPIHSIHTIATRSCIQFWCQATYYPDGWSAERSHGTTSIQVSAEFDFFSGWIHLSFNL